MGRGRTLALRVCAACLVVGWCHWRLGQWERDKPRWRVQLDGEGELHSAPEIDALTYGHNPLTTIEFCAERCKQLPTMCTRGHPYTATHWPAPRCLQRSSRLGNPGE